MTRPRASALLRRLSRHPVMARLIADARADGVVFDLDPDNFHAAGGTQAEYDHDLRTVYINPRCTDMRELMSSIVHELRHFWQLSRLEQDHDTGEAEADERSARDKILITRVLEADAYAFETVVMRQLARGAAACAETLPADEMAAEFCKALPTLRAYDVAALSDYHRKYTHPKHPPARKPRGTRGFVTLAALRRVLQPGLDDNNGDYMAALDDLRLGALAMAAVRPAVRRPMRLIDRFQKAAARLSPCEGARLRRQIHRQVCGLK